jgi:hypothetical protein
MSVRDLEGGLAIFKWHRRSMTISKILIIISIIFELIINHHS